MLKLAVMISKSEILKVCILASTIVLISATKKIEQSYVYSNGAFFTRVGYFLPTNTLASFIVPGTISCNQKCLSNQDCVSYNYQVNKYNKPSLCELKSKGVKDETSDELKARPDFIFVQITNSRHSPRSCFDHLKNGAKRSGVYLIHGNKNSIYKVYCDLESEPNSAWTLVMSHTLENVVLPSFRSIVLGDNSPVNSQWPRWNAYRLSLDEMKHIRSVSTHWRITCNFDTEPLQYRDYVRAKFAEFDAISFIGRGACKRVERINVRGHECKGCTAGWYQTKGQYNNILAHDSSKNICEFGSSPGYVSSEDNFGMYGKFNRNFRCTASQSSTTNLWFGVNL